MKSLQQFIRIIALPTSIGSFVAGMYEWSFWWFVGLAIVTGVAMADQRLGIDDPLDVRNFIPGKKREDVIAGLFAFVGSILGYGLIYWVGTLFS